MYTDPVTGLLSLPDANAVRFEVNGLLLEPEALLQYVRETGFDPTQNPLPTEWTLSAGAISASVPSQVDPTGTGASARVLSNTSGVPQYIQQIIAGLDPGAQPYRFSVFLKPLPPAVIPDVRLYVNYSGGTPVTVQPLIVVDPTSGWLRYDLLAINTDVANTAVTVRVVLETDGDIAIWGANFTESNYLASYRPRPQIPGDPDPGLITTGEEHLIYDITAMGIEPLNAQAFTVLWEFLPLGKQGEQAPKIAFADGDSNGDPTLPGLYDKAIEFGAHPNISFNKLAIVDATGFPSVNTYTHATDHVWTRYSHQKWAFVVFNDGSQKCRFFANGTFLGEVVISPALTEDNYTKFVLPQAALHRRIETLAEALTNDAAIAATTIT
jgi:hypothetical protein